MLQLSRNQRLSKTMPIIVKDSDGDKAPALEGFTLAFFQKGWEVVKTEILNV